MSNQVNQKSLLKAPEFDVKRWIDAAGIEIDPLLLSDFKGSFKVVYCFQYWCPGCHKRGLPDLKKMVEGLKDHPEIVFFAIQTVFEGHHENTFDKIRKVQERYDLKIPFGHDAGNDEKSTSNMMNNYQTGGTPWFIFIDKFDNIVFADFHLNAEAAINFLKTVI